MKLFVVGLLLVQSAICIMNGTPFSRHSCLQLVNTARAGVADKLQVANMNALFYNRKMEKVIHQQLQFVNGCPNPSIISHKGLDVYLNVGGQKDLIVELLSAADNSMMACVKSRCEENGQEVISIVTDLPNSAPISGAPGTQCAADRLVTSQGLCALENPSRDYERKFFDLFKEYVIDPVGDVIKKEVIKKVEKAVKTTIDEAEKVFS